MTSYVAAERSEKNKSLLLPVLTSESTEPHCDYKQLRDLTHLTSINLKGINNFC